MYSSLVIVEKKAMHAVKEIHKNNKPAVKTRLWAPVKLNQAYTSGHVVQGHADEVRRKEGEAREKQLKKDAAEKKRQDVLNEKARKRNEAIQRKNEAARKKRQEEIRKQINADARKREAARRKADRKRELETKKCKLCNRKKTLKTMDRANWFLCENCRTYSLCPAHTEEIEMHKETCV